MSDWYVYIVSNNAHTLYVGATNDLPRRIREHKNRSYVTSFTARYTFDRCVYYELVGNQRLAIEREQKIKKWPRHRKVALIQTINPNWIDLSTRWSLERILS
jgi:putative endonuclease